MAAMAAIKDTLRADLTTAMKEHADDRVATIRMALTAIATEEVAGKQARELTEADEIAVLTKEAKRRREAATAFTGAGRSDRADQELAEAAIIAQYLPAPLTKDEVRDLVATAVAGAAASGLTGGRAMGAVMKELKPATTGRFDGAELAVLVKQALGIG